MAFEVVRARGCDRDLAALFDALVEGYRALGDTLAEAHSRAALRLRSIEATLAGLGRTAFLGRERPDLAAGPAAADRRPHALRLHPRRGGGPPPRPRHPPRRPRAPRPLLRAAAAGQTTATPSASAARRSAASSVASRPRPRSASSR